MAISFVHAKFGFLAWIALVPWFFEVCRNNGYRGVISGGLFGVAALHGIFYWMLSVSGYRIPHHVLLLIILGSFYAILGLILSVIANRFNYLVALWAAPFCWVAMEYARSNFSFLELPMGLIGHTQYTNPSVIQLANLGGAYSVSFVVVMVNAAVAGLLLENLETHKRKGEIKKFFVILRHNFKNPLSVAASVCVIFVFLYGWWTGTQPVEGKPHRISLVQGNIDQAQKWDPDFAESIVQTYVDLTLKASLERPDLIIWPETATPGSALQDLSLLNELKMLAQMANSHLVAGSAHGIKFERENDPKVKYQNNALMISPDGKGLVAQQYTKIKLFPFGEYLPYDKKIPWEMLKIKAANEYISGNEFTVFKHPAFDFAVTICWENLFPRLCRQFTKNGAQVLINITNEARFGKTAAPYQLMRASVFRAVENGVYVIRCANTGVSCIIDPFGRIVDRVRDNDGNDIFVQGILSGDIIPMHSSTFYKKHGDVFAWACIIVSCIFSGWALLPRRNTYSQKMRDREEYAINEAR